MVNTIYLSVVIPVRNEQKCTRATLEALLTQDYPKARYELIVVDGRSTDQTRDAIEQVIREHPKANVRLLDNPGRWSSRGRNIGIRAAKGGLIAIVDGHVKVSSNRVFAAIERLREAYDARCLAHPRPITIPGVKEGMPFWIAQARRSWLGHSRKSFVYSDYAGWIDPVSSGAIYDRRVFDRVGYFDEAFDAAEDVEFNYRVRKAGIEAYTSPELTIYSYPRTTLCALFRQMVRYGVGRARFVRKHPASFTKETLIPLGVLLLSAVLPIAVSAIWWLPAAAIIYTALFSVYWLPVLATSFGAALRRGRLAPGLVVAAAIWTTHVGLGWGFLKTIFLPRRVLFGGPCFQAGDVPIVRTSEES